MMSDPETKTEIRTNGLRYKSKVNGSPFGGSGTVSPTMSCYKCGLHKPRKLGTFKKIIGNIMFVCNECAPTSK